MQPAGVIVTSLVNHNSFDWSLLICCALSYSIGLGLGTVMSASLGVYACSNVLLKVIFDGVTVITKRASLL